MVERNQFLNYQEINKIYKKKSNFYFLFDVRKILTLKTLKYI